MKLNVIFVVMLTVTSVYGAPWNITKVGDLVSDYYLRVVGNGEVAYAASPYGLLVVDVSDRTQPRIVRRIETEGSSGQMAVRDSLLYFCDGYMGLKIFRSLIHSIRSLFPNVPKSRGQLRSGCVILWRLSMAG